MTDSTDALADIVALIHKHSDVLTPLAFTQIRSILMREIIEARGKHKGPYPSCRTPEKCAPIGYCRNDPACND